MSPFCKQEEEPSDTDKSLVKPTGLKPLYTNTTNNRNSKISKLTTVIIYTRESGPCWNLLDIARLLSSPHHTTAARQNTILYIVPENMGRELVRLAARGGICRWRPTGTVTHSEARTGGGNAHRTFIRQGLFSWAFWLLWAHFAVQYCTSDSPRYRWVLF